MQTNANLDEYAHTDVDREFGAGFSSDGGDHLTLADYHGIIDRWRKADDSDLNGVESWANFMSRGLNAVNAATKAAGPDGQLYCLPLAASLPRWWLAFKPIRLR